MAFSNAFYRGYSLATAMEEREKIRASLAKTQFELKKAMEEEQAYDTAVDMARVPSEMQGPGGFNLLIPKGRVNPELIPENLMQLGKPRLSQEYQKSVLENEQSAIKNAADQFELNLKMRDEVAKARARQKAVVNGKYGTRAYIGALKAEGRDDLAQEYLKTVLNNEKLQQELNISHLEELDKEFDLKLKQQLRPFQQEVEEKMALIQGYQWLKATGGMDQGGALAIFNELADKPEDQVVSMEPVIQNGQVVGAIVTQKNGRVFPIDDAMASAFAADANTRFTQYMQAVRDAEKTSLTPGRAQMVIQKHFDDFMSDNTTRAQDLLMWRAADVLARPQPDPDTGLLRPGYIDPELRKKLESKGFTLPEAFTPFRPDGGGVEGEPEGTETTGALGQPPQSEPLYNMAPDAVGVSSALVSFASRIPFGIGEMIAETDKAKRVSKARATTQSIRTELSQVFRENARSEKEREELLSQVARINSSWFNSPENFRNELKNLNDIFSRHMRSALRRANDRTLSSADREKARGFYRTLQAYQEKLFPPGFFNPVQLSESMTDEEFIEKWNKIPVGSYFVVDGEGHIKARE